MILVTTPNGKIGSEIVKQLLSLGVPVRAGAHTVEKARRIFPQAQVVPLDFSKALSVKAALSGVDSLYLTSPKEDYPTRPIKQTIDFARASGVKRVVLLSAMGVEHTEAAFSQIEVYLKVSGLAWTILRPNTFMQNYSTMSAETIRRQSTFFEPADDSKTSFIDTRDIATVAVKALTEDTHQGQVYTLTGERAYNRYEVATAISTATGKNVIYLPISDEQFRAAIAPLGWSHDYVEMLCSFYKNIRAGNSEMVTDTFQKVTGRLPITFEQFARDYCRAWT